MSSQLPSAVTYGAPGATVLPFHHTRHCDSTVPRILVRLRAAIVAADLWVLHEIDPQTLLSRGGFSILPARQVLFFHPRYVARMLSADPAALLEAPLKIALLEMPQGGSRLHWLDPAAAFSRYGNPALTELGKELAALCEKIVAAALELSS